MNDRVVRIMNHPATIPVVTGVVAFAAGVGAGYLLGRGNKYEIIPAEPTDDIPQSNLKLVIDAEDYREKVEETVVQSSGMTPVPQPDPEVIVTIEEEVVDIQNVFAASDGEWNQEAENELRKSSYIYVIHKDEFFEEERENDFTQSTLTYFASDNILVDEDDKPIYNFEELIGELQFGHGTSGDPDVFYVRNEKRKGEYEIMRNDGFYSVDVLGLEIEDNQRAAKEFGHSNVAKFRRE